VCSILGKVLALKRHIASYGTETGTWRVKVARDTKETKNKTQLKRGKNNG
jgi:hypothetical protein